MRAQPELEQLYLRHRQTVWNICYPFFLNPQDTEDALQDTFVHLASCSIRFRDEQHEKAWLITTARNICRDELRKARRKNIPLDTAGQIPTQQPALDETLLALHKLPEKYRTVLYLYYYEAYSTAQIAQLLRKPEGTIRSDLRRGRLYLRKRLEAKEDETT